MIIPRLREPFSGHQKLSSAASTRIAVLLSENRSKMVLTGQCRSQDKMLQQIPLAVLATELKVGRLAQMPLLPSYHFYL